MDSNMNYTETEDNSVDDMTLDDETVSLSKPETSITGGNTELQLLEAASQMLDDMPEDSTESLEADNAESIEADNADIDKSEDEPDIDIGDSEDYDIDLTGFTSIDGRSLDDDFYDFSQEMDYEEDNYTSQPEKEEIPRYSRYDFEREVFGTDVMDLIELLEYKKNIILQGSPGVGKTHTGKRLAYAMMGEKDNNRIMQVQFHQSYTYEDFIVGLRPTSTGGFEFVNGPFYEMCKRAEADAERRPYFFIIDEINRGNMSKILGEMFSLIEKDHRNEEIMLKYNSEMFSVPDNLYIIGTMNTADRGLVMLDYALRRRFAFITVEPKFKSSGFRQLMQQSNNPKFNRIVREIVSLNEDICKDEMLGPGFQIGHSYFCLRDKISDAILSNIINYEIMPLLDEYWYDNTDKIYKWRERFDKVLNMNNN